MTDQQHPSLDDLADLHEELLDPQRADEVTEHVRTCSACTDALADLEGVRAVLASVGSEPLTMPVDVAASVEAALARARLEEAAGVPSLAERRAAEAPSKRRGLATRFVLLGAAATVVGVVGVGFNSLLSSSDDSGAGGSSSADNGLAREQGSAGDYAAGGAAQGPQPSDNPAAGPTQTTMKTAATLPAREVAARARALVQGRTHSEVQASGRCAEVTAEVVGKQMRSAVVRFTDQRAVLVADPAPREARIYSCASSALLFSTAF